MSLTTTEQLLLSALLPTEASRARLQQLARLELDWLGLVKRAEFNYLAPLLRYNLAQSGTLACLPVEAQRLLEQSGQTWAARHLAYVHETERLMAELAAAQIPALPLKGAALMLGGYYPQAGLRAAVDIDLLVEPGRIHDAERIAQAGGYAVQPGRTKARPRQRLANELNHVAPRRGRNGLLLELHTRAFHYVQGARDFGLAEMQARARLSGKGGSNHEGLDRCTRLQSVALANGAALAERLSLPAPEDLALHLIHHTLVDLQSTRAILRTLADLHFVLAREATALTKLCRLGEEMGFGGAVETALQVERLLATGDLTELKEASQRRDGCALLLETALLEEPLGVADAARLFEYFDFSRAPLQRLGKLAALVFTNRAHLTQLHGEETTGRQALRYFQRPFALLRKFNWESLRPGNLGRVWRLRKMARTKSVS